MKATETIARSMRPNRVEVDPTAFAENVGVLRGALPPGTKLFGAVKANAYGFGLVAVSRQLADCGIDGLSMADLGDAIALRRAGLRLPILLYGGSIIDRTFADAVVEFDIAPTIHDSDGAAALSRHLQLRRPAFFKVDCGLERVGFAAEEAVARIHEIVEHGPCSVAGLYTHLHVPRATIDHRAYLDWQIARFQAVVSGLRLRGVKIPITMAESSSVLSVREAGGFDAADPGHWIYGLDSGSPAMIRVALRSALVSISTRLIQARAPAWAGPRLAAPIPVDRIKRIGVIPFGLFDGMDRASCGEVIVCGQRVAMLSRPSLEHTRIDLSAADTARVGDPIVLIGRQGSSVIEPGEVLAYRGLERVTDIMMAIPEHVPRVEISRADKAS